MSSNLVQSFRGLVEDTAKQVERFPWEDREFYATWLSQTYFLVSHTTRFLCLAAARTPVEARAAHYGFLHHLNEELQHDLPLLKDLKAMGREIGEFTPLKETRLILHNQYFWLDSGKPHALTGYGLMLEGLSVRNLPAILKTLATTPSANATAFMRLHLDVDQEHSAEGLEALEHLPAHLHEDVLSNLEESSWLYVQLLTHMASQLKTRNTAPLKRAA